MFSFAVQFPVLFAAALFGLGLIACIFVVWFAKQSRQQDVMDRAAYDFARDVARATSRAILVYRARQALETAGLHDVLDAVSRDEMLTDADAWSDAELAQIASLGEPIPDGE